MGKTLNCLLKMIEKTVQWKEDVKTYSACFIQLKNSDGPALNEIVELFESIEYWGLFREYVEYYSSLDISKYSKEFDKDIAKMKSW